VHPLSSLHALPFATGAWPTPVAGLQLSVVQSLSSSRFGGAPALHPLDWHVSTPLQTFESAHDVPSGFGEHVPTDPATLHALQEFPKHASLQQTPSAQKPLAHWAFEVHVSADDAS
jgi:hypothetical protein